MSAFDLVTGLERTRNTTWLIRSCFIYYSCLKIFFQNMACQRRRKNVPTLEWAPEVGQFQAA